MIYMFKWATDLQDQVSYLGVADAGHSLSKIIEDATNALSKKS